LIPADNGEFASIGNPGKFATQMALAVLLTGAPPLGYPAG